MNSAQVIESNDSERQAQVKNGELARLVEETEAMAYADLLRAAPPEWQCQAERTPAGWLLLAPGLDILVFNRLVGCGIVEPAQRSDVEAAVARFQRAKLTKFGVQLSPAAQPPGVSRWLTEAGLAIRDRWTKLYRPASGVDPVQTNLAVHLAGVEVRKIFAEIITTGFGMPVDARPWIESIAGRSGWRCYLAWKDSEPVAGAALYVHGEIAWLGVTSTLPAARRQGAQGALLRRRIEDARRLGCRWLVTETAEELPTRPNPSYHNVRRAGFTVAYQRPNFMFPSSETVPGLGR
jgi:GNAT superfamily N-acetyltransferase